MNIDKRLIKLLGDSKKPLILAVTLGVLEIIALIAQAGLLAKVIDGAFLKGKSLDDLSVYLILFAAVSLVRALFSFLSRAETVKISGL
jgi:ATP-binding cassette subfamily C protein CydCD